MLAIVGNIFVSQLRKHRLDSDLVEPWVISFYAAGDGLLVNFAGQFLPNVRIDVAPSRNLPPGLSHGLIT